MGRPPVTSRAEILAAARRIIDRDGWQKLTIRRLAAELGIGATTLYHHVRNKQELLLVLVNEYVGQITRPELPDEPHDRIVAAATAMHDALAGWPWVADVISADGWLGLVDESALWPVETIVAGAIDAGCTSGQAVYVFRSIWYYTVGEILVRARTARGNADGESITNQGSPDNLDSPRLPQLAAVRNQWAELAARDLYTHGLRAFVDGLLAQTTAADVPPADGPPADAR